VPEEKKGVQKIKAVTIGEYIGKNNKSYPTISIPVGEPDDGCLYWPFTFGVGKAKAILEHLDAIRAFAEEKPF